MTDAPRGMVTIHPTTSTETRIITGVIAYLMVHR